MALILFLFLPVLEIYVFVKAIQAYGFWAILFEVILTAWLGFTVLRFRSLIVMGAINKTLSKKASMEKEMLKSVLIFLGAILLIVPGLITDVIGLLCLFGPTRTIIGSMMSEHLSRMAQDGRFSMVYRKTTFGREKTGVYDVEDIGGSVREVNAEGSYLETQRKKD